MVSVKTKVKFIIEEEVVGLLYREVEVHRSGNKVIPTISCSHYYLHLVPTLAAFFLSAIGVQPIALSWPIAHIQLTEEEAVPLRGISVTYARDLGFFFEPDHRTNILKVYFSSPVSLL